MFLIYRQFNNYVAFRFQFDYLPLTINQIKQTNAFLGNQVRYESQFRCIYIHLYVYIYMRVYFCVWFLTALAPSLHLYIFTLMVCT